MSFPLPAGRLIVSDMRARTIMLLSLLMLAGCGDPGDESTTMGGLTADEAAQLNDVAEMLDVGNQPPLPVNTLAP